MGYCSLMVATYRSNLAFHFLGCKVLLGSSCHQGETGPMTPFSGTLHAYCGFELHSFANLQSCPKNKNKVIWTLFC
jgi:hypothetical protein